MGLGTEADWQELDQMAALYPEVKDARIQYEIEQENQHLGAAPVAISGLQQAVFSQLSFDKKAVAPVVGLPTPDATAKATTPVVSITAAPKSVRWLRGAVAACIVMLMGSAALNFYFYSLSVQYQNDFKALASTQNSLLAKNKAMQTSFDMVRSPKMKKVPLMPASPKMEGAMATVYWNTANKDVYLMINNLPKIDPNKQYQLWAMVDGKPVDAGMLEMNEDVVLVKMKNIPKASAFAITMENKGGSPSPNMDEMFVYGDV